NISAQQLLDPQLLHRVTSILTAHGIPSGQIKMEITERTILSDPERAATIMRTLEAQGVGFYLDDFGTGYSNMFYVTRLPLECVKLDKSLLNDIESNPRALEMLSFFAEGLRHAGVKVLVEGVENDRQYALIRTLPVDLIQGYYLSRPMDERRFLAWLRGMQITDAQRKPEKVV
ncbi:MAG: EAL domain-containing protein, partial [Eubacteriales bacterium]|nr:EAL domain-containing protein [Eubacteriales bacterium]